VAIVAIVAAVAIVRFVAENLVVIAIVGGGALLLFLLFRIAGKRQDHGTMSEEPAVPDWRPAEPGLRRTATLSQIPAGHGDPVWIPERESASLGDWRLGSLLYFGIGLRAVGSEEIEPALIDPRLPVARGVTECSTRRLPYWSSYSEVTPEARAAYLHWLRTGRKDPTADIGYVFLFFYGLERRALHDVRSSAKAVAEVPVILDEVTRLLGIYGEQRSFRGYAIAFLDFLAAQRLPARSYAAPPVDRGSELSFLHRLALGQCAADGKPMPASWALLWVTHDRSVSLGTAARRCPREFGQMFELLYRDKYGNGLVLPRNRTLLRLDYRPASASFRGTTQGLSIETGLPDVSVLSSPVKKLAEVAELASEKVARYSRIVGKMPTAAGSFEALVELPIALWPPEYRKQLESVRDVVARAKRPAAVPFEKFRSWVPEFSELTRGKLRALYVALSGVGLGMEPDVRFGGSVPALDSRVVLFADDPETSSEEASPRYLAASLTLHLAAAVAGADGETSEAEKTLLMQQMEEWLSLTESERRRLHAHLRLLLVEPPKLTGLKKRIEGLDTAAREAVADFLSVVAQADDRVTPEEIRQLQKIFRLLGLNPEAVYSKVHAAATEPVSVVEGDEDSPETRPRFAIPPAPVAAPSSSGTAKNGTRGVVLDAAKVAALQRDSERVASILAAVFEAPAEENALRTELADARSAASTQDEKEESSSANLLLGLDGVHSGLLETLLTRTQWARGELEELAEDRELMLDGALERLNEACFERFDMALFEDGDPMVLSAEAVREVLGVEHQGA
jgi:tellurite resistance protein